MTHPTDGALMALVDRAVGGEDGTQLDAHVALCERCRELMSSLEHDQRLVGTLLEELDGPVPDRSVASILVRAQRRRRWRWQVVAAAASLLVVAIGSATMRPDLWRNIANLVRPPAHPAGLPAGRPGRPPVEAPTVIALDPTRHLAIDFAASQAAGEILITLGSDTRVTVSASGTVPYTVSEGAITVDNVGSRATYHIALPAGVEQAAIRVGGRTVFDKRRATILTKATRDAAGRYRIALDRVEAR